MSQPSSLPAFLRPLWVRLGIVVAVTVWGAFEFSLGNVVWALLFFVAAAWALWDLVLRRRSPPA